jgi:D-alanyl-D-alanine carboxypeptidase
MLRRVAVLALAPSLAAGSATAPPLDRARITASVDSLIAEERRNVRIPGMTVLIAQGSQPVVAKAYGIADLDHDVPAGPETVYAIASITKQFTAAAIVKLASEGKLGLDDDISSIVPDLPMVRGPVTIRQLLQHTSGIPGVGPFPGRNANRLDYTREEWLAAVREVYKDRAPLWPSGEGWSYTDANYIVLGLAIEKITGRTLWDYFHERFFTPLGMTSTARCDPGIVVKRRARGYVLNEKAPTGVVPAPFVSPTLALGNSGLCASAPDLLKWQRALVEGKVEGVQYAQLAQPGTLNDRRVLEYGLGLMVWPLGRERVVFHTGGTTGYTSYLAYLPGNDVTVIVLANANSDVLRIGADLARVARGLPSPRNLTAAREELARYAGTYASGSITALVQENDGRLEARVTGSQTVRFAFPVRLLKQGDAEFVLGWEPESRVTFRVSGDRATALVLRYGDRTVELAREVVAPPPSR